MKVTDLKFFSSSAPSTDITNPIRSIVIVGENQDIDTASTPEVVWENSGTLTLPTAATAATIVSSSASDTAAGTGARAVLIEGLDSNYKEIVETVTLNGTSNVTSVNSYLRVNFFRVISSGSNRANVGNISCTVNGNIISYIGAGESLAHVAVFTVPLDHTLFLTNTAYSVLRATSARYAAVSSNVYVPSTGTIYQSSTVDVNSEGGPSNQLFPEDSRPRIPEKCDLIYICEYVSANDTSISVSSRGLLVYKSLITRLER